MIGKVILIVLGIVLFSVGFIMLKKSQKDKKAYKRYGSCAYFGLALSVLGLILSLEVYLRKYSPMLILLVVGVIFAIIAKKLVAPGFK